MQQYKEDAGLDYFIETSAKTGFNANKVFIEAAKHLYIDYLKYKDKVDKSRSSSVSSNVIKKSIKQPIRISSVNNKLEKAETKESSKCSC